MKTKTIVLTILATLFVVVCLFALALLVWSQLSPAPFAFSQSAQPLAAQPGNGPGYGRGMMGGRGPMMGGPGAFATPFAPEGYAPPSGGSRGLVAITADGKPIPAASDAPKLPENTAAQKVGNLNVTLALSPYPPASFQKGDFDIALIDNKSQAVTDAKISLDLTMPGMWMPPSKPDAQNIGNGKYHASAFYTMRGLWRIEVIITRGSEKQSAFFDVWL